MGHGSSDTSIHPLVAYLRLSQTDRKDTEMLTSLARAWRNYSAEKERTRLPPGLARILPATLKSTVRGRRASWLVCEIERDH
jgi:hypothetical protein